MWHKETIQSEGIEQGFRARSVVNQSTEERVVLLVDRRVFAFLELLRARGFPVLIEVETVSEEVEAVEDVCREEVEAVEDVCRDDCGRRWYIGE